MSERLLWSISAPSRRIVQFGVPWEGRVIVRRNDTDAMVAGEPVPGEIGFTVEPGVSYSVLQADDGIFPLSVMQ